MNASNTPPSANQHFFQTGRGILKKGVGRLPLPYPRPDGSIKVKIDFAANGRKIEARIQQADPNTLNIEGFENNRPIQEDLEFSWSINISPPKDLLKDDPNIPPKMVSILQANFAQNGAFLDFGFCPPYVKQEDLEEHSIDVHTRLFLDPQMVELLSITLQQAIAVMKSGNPQQAITAMKVEKPHG